MQQTGRKLKYAPNSSYYCSRAIWLNRATGENSEILRSQGKAVINVINCSRTKFEAIIMNVWLFYTKFFLVCFLLLNDFHASLFSLDFGDCELMFVANMKAIIV